VGAAAAQVQRQKWILVDTRISKPAMTAYLVLSLSQTAAALVRFLSFATGGRSAWLLYIEALGACTVVWKLAVETSLQELTSVTTVSSNAYEFDLCAE
jgi:hypothetical protein